MTDPKANRDTVDQDEVDRFLDWLEDTGATNMFGAGPFLERAFGLSEKDARDKLLRWIKTYAERKAKEAQAERDRLALAEWRQFALEEGQ